MIKLSTEEVSYLLRSRFLSERLLSLLHNAEKNNAGSVVLDIQNEVADEFRDAFGERMQEVGFDKDYKPTTEGEILEALIDRFFVGR